MLTETSEKIERVCRSQNSESVDMKEVVSVSRGKRGKCWGTRGGEIKGKPPS